MIKWFDADKFLPGRNEDLVLVRYYRDKFQENYDYLLGIYQGGQWFAEEFNIPESYTVTHWAHINEPFE